MADNYLTFSSSDRTALSNTITLSSDNNHLTVNGLYVLMVDENGRLPSGAQLMVLDKGHIRAITPADLQPANQLWTTPVEDCVEVPALRSRNEFADVPGGSTWDEDGY